MSEVNEQRKIWLQARGELIREVLKLGFPEELGAEIVKNLGSPKAMGRMTVYLKTVKPKKAEMIVDEMLAIMSDIRAWKDKKSSLEANAAYNEIMYYGFDEDEDLE